MIKYLQLPFYFDVVKMQQEVSELAGNRWKLHYQVRHYEGEWSAIPLRSVNGDTDNIIVSPETSPDYKDTVFLSDCPYLKEVLQHFECPLLAVRLLKLNAGAIIKEHRDYDLQYEKGEIRVHIPVVTHEAVEFYLDNERVHPKEGEAWYMNFNLPHSIRNGSPIHRIHLVIDAQVNEWVKDMFRNKAVVKKEAEEKGPDSQTKLAIIAQLRSMNTDTSNKMADEMEAALN